MSRKKRKRKNSARGEGIRGERKRKRGWEREEEMATVWRNSLNTIP